MGNKVDVFMTTKAGRDDVTRRSLDSLEKHWDDDIRLTVHIDGPIPREGTFDHIVSLADYVIISRENEGLGPAINRCLSHIETNNKYYEDRIIPDAAFVSHFVCMVQDDLQYSEGWLKKLRALFMHYENKWPGIGFASGIECVEHPVRTDIKAPQGIVFKDYIRAANMFGRRSYWMSMHPITRFDPETRNVRAKPNDGIGSGVDWWFIRDHEKSVVRTNRTCLVVPGLLQHIGYNESTWLDRELPESEEDKKKVG